MESVKFKVGAKAARLIGRENIADVDGALIELIKNSYDADATCVCVYFDMPFPFVPTVIDDKRFNKYIKSNDKKNILELYELNKENQYVKKEHLTSEQEEFLKRIFLKYNRLIVADNGTGMSYEDVKSKWMYIGTSDKETDFTSGKGRIKTGAKGIGRFALDKLAISSQVYTKSKVDPVINWRLNWEQFESARLINDVNATLDKMDKPYIEYVKRVLGKDFPEVFLEQDWQTGTIIELSPIREEWSLRLFKKVNDNLKSINPLGAVDPFKVYVYNEHYSEYQYKTDTIAISEQDYDYRIHIIYDGADVLKTELYRNEVDINKKSVLFKEHNKKVSLESFWNRPYFAREKYNRKDFDKKVEFSKKVTDFLKDDITKVQNVGPFTADLYFIKSKKSPESIIKSFTAKNRRELLDNFSGIKLYRDSFKVRPYGDEGNYYDWLRLGRRQESSPGGVGSESGTWKVLAYQLIGQVQIGRVENPALYDMANREALTQNDEYEIFIEMIQEAIQTFESDRQGFYREYSKWEKEIKSQLGPDANIRAISKKVNSKKESESTENEKGNETGKERFTEEEYQQTVYNLMKEAEEALNAKQILQLLSSSGLIINTFFHEFKAIQSEYGSRAPQLERRLNYMVENNNLHPGFVYDPYIIIEQMRKTDEMLALWLKVAMEGVEKPLLKVEKRSIDNEIESVIEKWKSLLQSKEIEVVFEKEENDYSVNIAKADIYIVLNNFFLNSVYFLEKEKNMRRKIRISLEKTQKYILLKLWNNGPRIDAKYIDNPNRIFELGESSKEKEQGTGVGLWITKETIDRYNGTILVTDCTEGFGVEIYL